LVETDQLHAPTGAIAEAQALAARCWGADETWFLVNGSTVGIQALVMAACPPGTGLALTRSSHMAVLGGAILAGARPVFLSEVTEPGWDLPGPPDPVALDAAFASDPDLRAVLVTRPDYYGRVCDLGAIAAICRRHDRLLLVDEAHGAHLGLAEGLPPSALTCGADGVVQSTHKLLSAFTQASMLHVRGPRLDCTRIRKVLRLLQSSSPSYLLLGSLDAARDQVERDRGRSWGEAIALTDTARKRLLRLGIPCLGPDHGPEGGWDPAKLVLDLVDTGLDGFALADHLHAQGVVVELATPRYLVALVTPGLASDALDHLIDGVVSAPRCASALPWPGLPQPGPLACLPREAYLADSRTVTLAEAIGKVSAEFVCPYPPGIPALIPGEVLTSEVTAYLEGLGRLGAEFIGPTDPTLKTIQVCDARP
jgi:arginine/lysine/ornithine decarboxylase